MRVAGRVVSCGARIIIALVLVSGGLITSSAVELFFQYRESVEAIWSLQRR